MGSTSFLRINGIFELFPFLVIMVVDFNKPSTFFSYFGNKEDIVIVSLFHLFSFKGTSSVILPHSLPFILKGKYLKIVVTKKGLVKRFLF